MTINIRYTPLGAAFADKSGRAVVEERIRGELEEMLSDTGGLAKLSSLIFHTVWMGSPGESDTFLIVPDKSDPNGVVVDAEAPADGEGVMLDAGPLKGFRVHIPTGASLNDHWREDDEEKSP